MTAAAKAPATRPARQFDEVQVRTFLSHLMDPAIGAVELRILECGFHKGKVTYATSYQKTIAGWFDRESHLVAAAAKLEGVSGYVTVNPVRRDLLARTDNDLRIVKSGTSKDEDVVCVRWLFIDIDPTRPDQVSSTDQELAKAVEVRDRILFDHPEITASAIWGCSGNGAWILVRLADLANNDHTYKLLDAALSRLALRYGRKAKDRADTVVIDEKTKNASRVMCLPGTMKCKGSSRPERPWRLATIESPPADPANPLPMFDIEGWLDRNPAPVSAPAAETTAQPAAPAPLPIAGQPGAAEHTTAVERQHRLNRASSYVAAAPPAISGQGGHDQTYSVAVALVHGFALSIAEARPILDTYNARCDPPWESHELDHKLDDAANKQHDKPRGHLYDAPHPNTNGDANGYHATGEGREFLAALLADGGPNGGPIGGDGAAIGQAHVGPVRQPGQAIECPPGQEMNPHRLARLFLSQRHGHIDGYTLRFWRDEFHEWAPDKGAYQPVPQKEVRAAISQVISAEFERIYLEQMMRFRMRQAAQAQQAAAQAGQQGAGGNGGGRPNGGGDGGGGAGGREPKLLPVTSGLTTDVLQAVASVVLLPVARCSEAPAWIGPADDPAAGWSPRDVLPTRGALVHLPSLAGHAEAQRRAVRRPTPRFLTTWATDYDFHPQAPRPTGWLKFLHSVWPNDDGTIATLQEWFGYCLTPDTRHQKMLLLIGPPRSGKGTISRILRAMIGEENVAGPTMAGLAEPRFGLAPLIGKPLAIIDDARLSGRSDQAIIVERLLSITGEGTLTVDRKSRDAWTGKLPTRLVLLSNELPRLTDASGALAKRLILLRMTETFLGKEDKHLFDRLVQELPGILLWAIEGWRRLQDSEEFKQPESASALVDAMSESVSPIMAFVQDCCVLGEGHEIERRKLFGHWKLWNEAMGTDQVGDERSFGRKIHAAVPGLKAKRPREGEARVWHYIGITLKSESQACESRSNEGDSYLDHDWTR